MWFSNWLLFLSGARFLGSVPWIIYRLNVHMQTIIHEYYFQLFHQEVFLVVQSFILICDTYRKGRGTKMKCVDTLFYSVLFPWYLERTLSDCRYTRNHLMITLWFLLDEFKTCIITKHIVLYLVVCTMQMNRNVQLLLFLCSLSINY